MKEQISKMSSDELKQKNLVRKIAPKKTISDAQGDWEVVDDKKTMLVEEEN